MKMDEDAELAASGARGDVALRMPPTPGPAHAQALAHSGDRPPEAGTPSAASRPAAGPPPAAPHPAPGRLAASGPPGYGGFRLGSAPQGPAGGPGRGAAGVAASMPAAVAAGGGERRRAGSSTDASGARPVSGSALQHAQHSPATPYLTGNVVEFSSPTVCPECAACHQSGACYSALA